MSFLLSLSSSSVFFQVTVIWLIYQLSSFPACISLPISSKPECPPFGSFAGNFSVDHDCCLKEFANSGCHTLVDIDSAFLLEQNEFLKPRPGQAKRSSLGAKTRTTRDLDGVQDRIRTTELNICEVRATTLQPVFGTLVFTGKKAQILQLPGILVQNVYLYTCVPQPTNIIRGTCVQQYKPEEFITLSTVTSETGESIVALKREFLWVESGCRATFQFNFLKTSNSLNDSPISSSSSSTLVPSIELPPNVSPEKELLLPAAAKLPAPAFLLSPEELSRPALVYDSPKRKSAGTSEHKAESTQISETAQPSPGNASKDTQKSSTRTERKLLSHKIHSNSDSTGNTAEPNENVDDQSTKQTESDYLSEKKTEYSLLNPENQLLLALGKDEELREEFSNQKGSSPLDHDNKSSHEPKNEPPLSSGDDGSQQYLNAEPISSNIRNISNRGTGEGIDIFAESESEPDQNLESQVAARSSDKIDTLAENRTGSGKHLQGIPDKIGLPIFLNTYEYDPVKNLVST